MPQQCTILSPVDDPGRVAIVVREIIGDRGRMALQGQDEDWSSIAIEGDAASLVLNRRVFREPGDEFARMRGGMWSHFKRVETTHSAIKAAVLEKVENFAMAVGVVAGPTFDEDAGHFECIFGLARALDAVVWNGDGVLDAEGNLILDGDGNSEIGDGDAARPREG